MAKYVINEKSDLHSLAKQVEEIAQRQETAEPVEAVAVHEVVPEETAFQPARARKTARQRPLLIGLVTAVAAVIVAGAAFMGFKALFTPRQRAIPDVVNARVDKALNMLESNGFSAKVEYDSASKKPSGTVVAQVPAANTKSRLGSAVTLRVAGKQTRAGAQAIGKNAGIIALGQGGSGTTPEKSDPAPTEKTPKVEKTEKQPETQASANVLVPAVEGLKADDAKKALQGLGVKIVEIAGNDAAKPNGVVLNIEPKVGSEVQAGSLVRLHVNARPKDPAPIEVERPVADPVMVTVQDYTGIAGKDAVIDLEHRGLKAEWSYQESNQYTAGTVILTTPPAGSRVAPGTKVTLVLSR
ncbi:MAG: PASTA domain-containing protein [Armatimonadota bacterium]